MVGFTEGRLLVVIVAGSAGGRVRLFTGGLCGLPNRLEVQG